MAWKWADGFIAYVNPANSSGTITIRGFDITEKGPSHDLHLCTYVGLDPGAYTAPVEAGDSNQDGIVTIIDALMMAQYAVGLCECLYFPPL
jgi:hypothetical protein